MKKGYTHMAQAKTQVLIQLDNSDYSKGLKEVEKVNKAISKTIQSANNRVKNQEKSFRTTATAVDDLRSSFKRLLALGVGAFAISSIANITKQNEEIISGLVAVEGSLQGAQARFNEFNLLMRDIPQSFEEVATSAKKLAKSGIKPTAELMKDLASIASGTGISLDQASDAFSNALLGDLGAIKAFGVVATKTGDQVTATFKNQTKTFKNSAKEWTNYISEITQGGYSDALNYQMSGISGAFKKLTSSFNDILYTLGNSEVGSFAGDVISGIAQTVDFLNEKLKSVEVQKFTSSFINFFKEIKNGFFYMYKKATDVLSKISKELNDSFGTDYASEFFTSFFDWLSLGVKKVTYYVGAVINSFKTLFTTMWTFQKDYFTAVSDGFSALFSFDFEKLGEVIKKPFSNLSSNFKASMNEIVTSFEIASKLSNKTSEEIAKKAFEREKEIENRHKANEEFLKNYKTSYSDEVLQLGSSSASNTSAKLESQLKAWRTYYANLLQLHNEQTLTTKQLEDLRYQNQLTKLEEFHAQGLASEEAYLLSLETLRTEHENKIAEIKASANEKYTNQINALNKNKNNTFGDTKEFDALINGVNSLSDAFSNLTDGMDQSSSKYKALFAVQKSFAVASATANAIVAWTKALSTSTTWYEGLANYASAIALTTSVLAQLTSVQMMDKGGTIRNGETAIVGEYGPELVTGSANVIGRKQTAEMLKNSMSQKNQLVVNLYEDSTKGGQVEQSQTDSAYIIDVFVNDIRQGGRVSNTLQNTFNLNRRGV